MSVSQVLRLDTATSTLVLAHTGDIPRIVYLGAALSPDLEVEPFVASQTRALALASLDIVPPISLHPEAALGFMGHPALSMHGGPGGRPGGGPDSDLGERSRWAGRFRLLATEAGEDAIRFRCEDAARALVLELTCRASAGADVFVLSSSLVNRGAAPCTVDWMSAPVIPAPTVYSHALHFGGRWCAEFELDRAPIALGQRRVENRTGRTSHEAFPGIVLLAEHTDEDAGRCLGAHLAWSGNHRIVLERMADGEGQLQLGELLLPGEGVLAPGERLDSPELHVAVSGSGLNALSQRFHRHVRQNVLRLPDPGRPRPVTVNTWEAVYFAHDTTTLRTLVDRAHRIGAERFVLDDGWFRGRDDDTTSLGDWTADSRKYPDGLGPIVDHVVSRGLEFGLWVEPEMVSPVSDLYRAHPDWVLRIAAEEPLTGRQQLVLDLTRPEVSAYVYESVAGLLAAHEIGFLKWDMNRNLVVPGDALGRPAARRQTLALYALIDRVREAFPGVEIESCASGGGRIDYGILGRTHRFWVSDSNDAVERMRIQYGFSYFFPPEVMASHIGPAWCHTSGRGLSLDLRAAAASCGHLGLELDLRGLDADEEAGIEAAIDRYKRDRSLWHTGAHWRVRTDDPCLLGAAVVGTDGAEARLVLAQLDRPRWSRPPPLRIPGLDPHRRYEVRIEAGAQAAQLATRRFDNPLGGAGVVAPGAVLGTAGVQLPILRAQTALALSVRAIGRIDRRGLPSAARGDA